ncbi:MAG: Ig-like domain-containing protein, partial [Dehalococcoidia bacterium]
TTVATVAAGLAEGVAEGDVVITATFDGMSDTADLEVTGPLVVESIVLSPEGDTVAPGDTIQFTAQATLSDGSTADVSGEAAWESSNSGMATVFAGLVIGVEEGTAEITATFGGVTGGPVTVTVIGVPPVVESIELTFESDSIGAGDIVQFTATATYPDGTTVEITGEVSWSSSDPDVATIVAGLATGESEGTAVITASVDGVQSDPITLTITAPAALQWWVILVIVLGLLAIGLILFLLLRRGGGEQPAEAA